jgi:protein-S-isoprenylcysteine O-methyltransferase Ste14
MAAGAEWLSIDNPAAVALLARMGTDRIIDYGERIFLVLLIAPFLLSFARYAPTDPYALALVASESLAVLLILIRKPGQMVTKPYPLIIAFLGTALPLFARPGGPDLLPSEVTFAMMIGGLIINIAAKLALNRSYGLVAANRGVKRGGPYRFVRHPMYLGYFVTQLGFLLSSFNWGLLALYVAAWTIQVLRILEEERVLLQDPAYQEFARQVPRRVLPGF